MEKPKTSKRRVPAKASNLASNQNKKKSPPPKLQQKNGKFPIVGIGASAGGLEAVILLLSKLPAEPGAGFVLISHLAPKKPSLTAEILSRHSKMPVIEAKEGMVLEKNHVYVIPPNAFLRLKNGALRLSVRTHQNNPYLPIDAFLFSLAEEAKQLAIGIVLSGTGSDGTRGLVAIKAEGGVTYAQDPKSAKYAGMPESAIQTGAVDLTLEPKEIAREITRVFRDPYIFDQSPDPAPLKSIPNDRSLEQSLHRIFSILNYTVNVDFTQYKRATLLRRIARRQLVLKIKNLNAYAEYLESHPDEVKSLFSDILIHVTSFFRDPAVFEKLKSQMLPQYLKTIDLSEPFRVWVPGCSSGEEAYSLAILLLEYFEEKGKICQVQIFASDISENSIQKARLGFYPDSIVTDLTEQQLAKYFEKVSGGYVVKKRVRNLCIFSRHDIISDPPFARIDLVSCRNLLIYFDEALQKIIFPLFHYSLKKNGILVLGNSENISAFPHLFNVFDKIDRIFTKIEAKIPPRTHIPPKKSVRISASNEQRAPLFRGLVDQTAAIQRDLEKLILKQYSPPSIVINEAMDIIQVLGKINQFIEFSSGQASLNLMRVAKPDLVPVLRKLVLEARDKNASVRKGGFQTRDSKDPQAFSIRVLPLKSTLALAQSYYAVIFEPSVEQSLKSTPSDQRVFLKKAKLDSRHDQLLELQQIKAREENLISLNEAYETTQEELTASNEELQTINEELQSSNEEMESAREELQSSNEELSTVNEELHTRNEQLIKMGADLEGLLASSDLPMVLIGADLRIRHFNPQTQKIIQFLASDVGRSINDLKIDLPEVNLGDIVARVVKNNSRVEVEVQHNSDRWYRLQAKPYSSKSDTVDGAVISLIDIQMVKEAQAAANIASKQLLAAKADTMKILESNPIPILILKSDKRIIFANPAFYQMFSLTIENTLERTLTDIGDGMLNDPEVIARVNGVMGKDTEFRGLEIQVNTPLNELKNVVFHARKIQLPGSGIPTTLVAIEDVSAIKFAEIGRFDALKLLQEVTSKSPGMLYQFQMRSDGSSCFPYASSGIKDIYRVNPEDVKEDASPIFSLLHPEDLAAVKASIQASFQLLSPWKLQYRVKHKNGDVRWLDGSATPAKQKDGSVLWHGFITDITESKKFELVLTESEEKYRKLVNSAYDGIMVVGEDFLIEVANPQLHLMFGYNPGELLHQDFQMLVPLRFRKDHLVHRAQYLAAPTSREMGRGISIFGLRKDGSEFPMEVSLSSFHSNSKLFVNCVARNITHLKEIETERAQILAREKSAREQAEVANRTKDEFLSILSHELRTPLTTILSWAQLLRKGTLDSDTAKSGIEILEQSAKAQGQLIDDLLDISRIQAGKMSLEVQKVQLSKIIWAAIDSTRILWAKKSIQIEVEIADDVKIVEVDPFRVQQILWNLITNAIKFSPEESSIRVEADLMHRYETPMIRIQVKDEGKGVKPEFIEVMFERFTQLDSSSTRVYGGLGLGLAIVKNLVELHSGFVEVESEGEDKGSNFIIYLPLQFTQGTTSPSRIEAPIKMEEDCSLKGLKILLVDDDASARHVFSIILESRDAEVRVVDSAAAALSALPNFKPDILVSDIGMPMEDGYSLIRKIRAMSNEFKDLPALALTAFASPGDIEKARMAGFQVHVAKPVDGNKLALEIAKLAKDLRKPE